ncbi:TonB-dependent receptor [Phenylobacterium sp. J367]|uniref:TonB-dependent receptor n=1 Tax=Phenylobacterium sp. J367 TaxID=2898435 RepID=UPI002150748C|nr:TonB-dependent receptor [Phenylobacterium sp. J367]MCR5878625.1 TonB-dependent receptor [Phenylobacterium sp. J367]
MNSSHKKQSTRIKAILLGATFLSGVVVTEVQAQAAVEEVVVTGFRRSLQQSTEAKRDATIIQDSIFAEDIGKFPDTNLAESLNRIPGVQLSREVTGEGLQIAIRGLGTNFTKILLNGNQIAVASTGRLDSQSQNREVDLDMFPTELFTRLDVNKTPTASMLEGGVSGTVNMRSARPFDFGDRQLTYSLQGSYNSTAEKWGPRGSLLASDTFDTGVGEFGVLVGFAGARTHISTEGFETIGWSNANMTCTGCNIYGGNNFNWASTVPAGVSLPGRPVGSPLTNADLLALNPGLTLQQLSDAMIPRLGRPAYTDGQRDRLSGLISFQLRPMENLELYFDTLVGRGIRKFDRVDMNWIGRNSNFMVPVGLQVDSNHVVTSGDFLNSQFFLEARPYHEKVNFFNLNPGFHWQYNDFIQVDGQFNMSKSEFLRESPTVLFNSPLGVGINVDYENPGKPYPNIVTNADLNNPALGWVWTGGGRVNIQNERRVTKTKAAHLDALFGDADAVNVKAGVAWDQASRSIMAQDNSARWQQLVCGGGGVFQPAPAPQPPCNGQAGSAVPASALASYLKPGPYGFVAVDYDRFFADTNYSELASTAPFSASANTAARSGVIDENTKGAYAEFNGRTDVGAWQLRFNGGVRYVSTEQEITGPVTFTVAGVQTTEFQTRKSRYDAYLPSFNAVLQVRDDVNLRLSASRTLTRPNPADMLPGTTFSDPSAQEANQGNPNLTPFFSNNFDIGAEWYTGAEGYVGIVGFNKVISGWTQVGTTTIPFSQLGIPFESLTATQQTAINNRGGPNSATVNVRQQINVGGTLTIRGYEANWVQPLSFLLDGLGFQANYTRIYQSASGAGAPPVAVGVSPYTYNVTGYYDHGPASIRVSYVYNARQTGSAGPENGITLPNPEGGTPIPARFRNDAYGQWDLSAGYQFEGFLTEPRITLDVINITKEDQRTAFVWPNATQSFYSGSRTILLGIRGKF